MSASLEALLNRAAKGFLSPSAAVDLADAALGSGYEEEAVPFLRAAAEKEGRNPALWQWSALLYRAIDEHEQALACFRRASALAPADPLIAHSLARTSLEAGLPARTLFDRARGMAPGNGEVLLGLAAARCAEGDSAEAEAELSAVLGSNPGWIAGHEALMQVRWIRGERSAFAHSVEQALARQPRNIELWILLLTKLHQADRFEDALSAAARARSAIGDHVAVLANEAAALSELGRHDEADRIFDRLAGVQDVSISVRLLRHLLRTGRPSEASRKAEAWLSSPSANLVIPYLSIAWRQLGDGRWEWLEGDERFVRSFDLEELLPQIESLASHLRSLHERSAQLLDQSVRGGTQTGGNLFQRLDPDIRALRRAIEERVRGYVAALPPAEPDHPFLRHRREADIRFTGAWSVRLTQGGSHANHVHPEGWISSAFYVAVPSLEGGEDRAGWLRFGVPQAELGIDPRHSAGWSRRPGGSSCFPRPCGTAPCLSRRESE